MNKTDTVLCALVKYVLAKDGASQLQAKQELECAFYGYESVRKDPEWMIMNVLMEIGAPDHLIGYPYVVRGVLMVLEDRNLLNDMTGKFYPELAKQFNTSANKVERAIRHVAEVAWTRGDYEAINRYFGNIVNQHKSKPTNSEFVARLANVIRMDLRM
jgi:two-component system response regulator (stage 0 sporulation protein A)